MTARTVELLQGLLARQVVPLIAAPMTGVSGPDLVIAWQLFGETAARLRKTKELDDAIERLTVLAPDGPELEPHPLGISWPWRMVWRDCQPWLAYWARSPVHPLWPWRGRGASTTYSPRNGATSCWTPHR